MHGNMIGRGLIKEEFNQFDQFVWVYIDLVWDLGRLEIFLKKK